VLFAAIRSVMPFYAAINSLVLAAKRPAETDSQTDRHPVSWGPTLAPRY
jgi:hypothetical protein